MRVLFPKFIKKAFKTDWAQLVGSVLLVWGVAFAVYRSLLVLSLLLFPLPIEQLEKDYSQLHLDANGKLFRIELSHTGKYRLYLPMKFISPYLREGFLAYEDQYFYLHPGINPMSLAHATAKNLWAGRVRRGGSTITMQLAKLLEPRQRTLGAKVIEMLRALQLEGTYSKDKLLEIYLNRVPQGGNIEGVGAAAYLYFGKPASQLSFAEASMLIGLPKSPNHFRPDRFPQRALAQRKAVMQTIARRLAIPQSVVEASLLAKMPGQRFANPHTCPHVQTRTRGFSNQYIRTYTIDTKLQAFCEGRLRMAQPLLAEWEIHNGAVLVINNRTMKVLAYVGTLDFKDMQYGGQVNAANILRSPGSLLKPFLYARGIETGKITPQSLVFDIPKDYDGYAPDNFDRQCRGPLTTQEALVLSLNNPAIHLEAELPNQGLAALLRKTKMTGDRMHKTDPGLSIVLGAFPLTLEELVRLYSVFSNGGRLRELCFFEEDVQRPNQGIPLLTPEACYLVTDMLSQLLRPDLPQAWEFTANRARVAYKTGTSFGLRDAWTIGFTPEYTVGVWLGNVNAQGSSALVGSKVAAPLMIEIMNELTRYQDKWYARPARVLKRKVCALSGEPAGPFCPNVKEDLFIPGKSRMTVCSIHKQIQIEKSTGLEVCRDCMDKPRHAYQTKIIELWPPEVAAFLRSQGRLDPILPIHNPTCSARQDNQGLKITSPMPGGEYRATQALGRQQQRISLKVQSQRMNPVFWYVDGKLIGHGLPDEALFIHPVPGQHSATAVNSMGQSDHVFFQVGR